jgi:hypothetical protein
MSLKELVEKAFHDFGAFVPTKIFSEEVLARFSGYFSEEPSGLCTENIISDECLFRDYSRLGSRKVDFARVRNPFTLSKFTISNYEKTWFIKGKSGELDGPHNSYDMDALFKKEKVTEETLIGITRTEFFTFRHFIEIVYPLPKVKQSYSETGSAFKGLSLFTTEPKITKIVDESDRGSARSVSVEKNPTDTPFKRTPFKNVVTSGAANTGVNEHFVQIESKSKAFMSDKKSGLLLQSGSNVGERFLVKSSKHNRNKHLTMSSQGGYTIEMNDIIGNYTAIKKEGDSRQYVDLRTKLDFKVHKVNEEKSEEDSDIDVDFDAMNVEKK